MNLHLVRDAERNGLLHQISKTPNAARFFATAAKVSWTEPPAGRYIDFYKLRGNDDLKLFSQRNKQHRTFLHELILAGNIRALDIVLSRKYGLGWSLAQWFRDDPEEDKILSSIYSMTYDENGDNVRDVAVSLGSFEMEKMVDEYAEWHNLYRLFQAVRHFYIGGEGDVPYGGKLSVFGEESASSVALRPIKFCRAKPVPVRDSQKIEDIVCSLAAAGRIDMLSWLVEVDDSLFMARSGKHVKYSTRMSSPRMESILTTRKMVNWA